MNLSRINSVAGELSKFNNTFQWKLYDKAKEAGVPTIRYWIGRNNHFVERMLERDVDKGRVGSTFKKLLEQKYCELIYLSVRGTKSLAVSYKDIKVLFNLRFNESENKISVIPVTVMYNKFKTTTDAEIIL